MKEKNLVICDSEIPYVTFLAENILEKDELDVHVQVCTSGESLQSFAKEHPIHIALIDETFFPEEVEAEKVVYLLRERDSILPTEKQCLFKYQHVDKLLAEVFAHTKMFRRKGDKRTGVIGIFTPLKEPKQSEFAICLGQALARDMKTLYLNLHTYAGEELFVLEKERSGLEDLFYFMKQGEEGLSFRLSAMVQEAGCLEYLMPFSHAMDLREVKTKEWDEMLSCLAKETNYIKVLLDMGEGVENVFSLLMLCDCIYMPSRKDEVSQRAVEKFENDLQTMGLSYLMERIQKVEITEDLENVVLAMAKEEWL